MTGRTGGYLVLEDGRRFDGLLHGALSPGLPADHGAPGIGEVVFQTGMTGYQEVITDPSYRGQIVAFTAPHIGNTGVNAMDAEAPVPALAGIVVRSLTAKPSSWRSEGSLLGYLQTHGLPCLAEVDTRALTRHIRDAGAKRGLIARADVDPLVALARVRAFPGLTGRNLVAEVAPTAEIQDPTAGNLRVTVVHCGMKAAIAGCLRERGARVRILPPTADAETILHGSPHGVVLSNGPGDPEDVAPLIAAVRGLLGQVPILGICLGHQILGLALGGKTYKMAFGHHGINHPVRDLARDAVLVTSQNHGFAVDPESFRPRAGGDVMARVVLTHVSLNDGVLEGFAVPELDVAAVQFHPEASAGPHDALRIFDDFLARAAQRAAAPRS